MCTICGRIRHTIRQCSYDTPPPICSESAQHTPAAKIEEEWQLVTFPKRRNMNRLGREQNHQPKASALIRNMDTQSGMNSKNSPSLESAQHTQGFLTRLAKGKQVQLEEKSGTTPKGPTKPSHSLNSNAKSQVPKKAAN